MHAALTAADPVIDIHEHYVKQTCRNRCTIITANGLMNLVIPVKSYRNHTPVAEIRVDYATNWQRVHAHALRSAYGKSAFFEYYADKILALYERRPEYLIEWNEACLTALCTTLKTVYAFRNSEEYVAVTTQTDLRPEAFAVQREPSAQYTQVFMERHGFYSGLSALDVLFCSGPEAKKLLTGVR
jgi:hypothetical protein